MKRIMIVGVGEFQIKGITEAKRLGYYVIGTDGDKNALGKIYCDEFFHIDVKDFDLNLTLAVKKKIDGVISIASEVSVETVAYISENLNLVGNDFNVAILSHNKTKYYNKLQEVGVVVPTTYLFSVSKLEKFNSKYIILKPSKGSGSRGVKKIELNNFDFDFDLYSNKYLNINEELLMQEYIEGLELTVDGFIYKNNFFLLAVSEQINDDIYGDTFSSKLIFPPEWLTQNIFNKIKDICTNIVKGLGIEFGPIHMEFKKNNKDEFFLIDFSLRGGGFDLFSEIIEKSSGINIVEKYIIASMNEKIVINQPKKLNPVMLDFFYANKPGKIQNIIGKEREGVHINYKLKFLKNCDDFIEKPESGKSRIGYLICWADNYKEVFEIKQNIMASVDIVME